MPMSKALKTRLKKIILGTKDEDINELWAEFRQLIRKKEIKYTERNFQLTDEVTWKNNETGEIISGTITEIMGDRCRVRQSNAVGSFWTISGILLTKDKTLKV